jgi:hypothetical protein
MTIVAALALAVATKADTDTTQAPAAQGKTTIGNAGVCDGTGARNAGQVRGNGNQGQKGSGQGNRIRKRDGSCPGGSTPTQTRQGKSGGKGRGRSGGA